MSNRMTLDQAAQRATELLSEQHFTPDYALRAEEPLVVSPGCIADLIAMNRITRQNGTKTVDGTEIEEIFSRTRVAIGTGLSVLRVSIGPLRASGPCDRLSDGRERRLAGWDFANTADLDEEEAWAGIAGVWPLSEVTARRARRSIFTPSVKGFVDGSLIRRVSGYHLDLATRRRWIDTEPLDETARKAVLSTNHAGRKWEHLWVPVPRGPIAEFTVNTGSSHIRWEQ